MAFGLSRKIVGVALLIVAIVVTAFWVTTANSGSDEWEGQLDEATITGFQSCLSNAWVTDADVSEPCVSEYFSFCGSVDFDYTDCLEELILAADIVTEQVISQDIKQKSVVEQFRAIRNECPDMDMQDNKFAPAQCRFMATVGFFVIEVN